MKQASPWSSPTKFFFRIVLRCRRLLPQKICRSFGPVNFKHYSTIEHIYVINLDRQRTRWNAISHELKHLLGWSRIDLLGLTERYAAVDATHFLHDVEKDADIDPNYTLGDQLFVEPQPLALPTRMDLNFPIRMSRPEIAVARSHIEVWRKVAISTHEYALILEDDVWFRHGFAKNMDEAWGEIMDSRTPNESFDILYLSYEEVKNGAPKTFVSSKVFRPVRGLWNLSGYVISRKGAQKLLQLLPCRGPVDLWINHQFGFLNVRAISRPVISQRPDFNSTNSYSILPTLTKIGAITSESASLFHIRPIEQPVFVFGNINSGLTSIAMALSMLGYRCSSDLETLPAPELVSLFAGKEDRVFNAYVNIGSLASQVRVLKECYPRAKFLLSTCDTDSMTDKNFNIINDLSTLDIATVPLKASNKWQIICEHLRCSPPSCSFPILSDLGQRRLSCQTIEQITALKFGILKWDNSPWIVEQRHSWQGIYCPSAKIKPGIALVSRKVGDSLEFFDTRYWFIREDTFTDNMALFRPNNFELLSGVGAALRVKKESLGVREYSAASLTSRDQYLYGRFEATIKVSNVPGVVTGFFLHRDSPRQEIDIEITGNRPDRLLVNVFYNPGSEGAKFDYGYRGAASYIDLGFDASESFHKFAIEWGPNEIRWFVDNCLVHRRVEWNPSPIPHLPMSLHVNVWPCRSKELAGRLIDRRLPASTFIKSIALEANQHSN